MFSVFKNKPSESSDRLLQLKLSESYFSICSDRCLTNLAKGFDDEEKVCLAKCLDRAHDYLVLAGNKIK